MYFFSLTVFKANLTLDADLQSSRVTSRALFDNLERVVQQDLSVSKSEVCNNHQVYVQEAPDLVNPIALRVDIGAQRPDASCVLDAFSPAAWEFFVSVISEYLTLWGLNLLLSRIYLCISLIVFVCLFIFGFRSHFLRTVVLMTCVTATWC